MGEKKKKKIVNRKNHRREDKINLSILHSIVIPLFPRLQLVNIHVLSKITNVTQTDVYKLLIENGTLLVRHSTFDRD